jgi:hypothetical protein
MSVKELLIKIKKDKTENRSSQALKSKTSLHTNQIKYVHIPAGYSKVNL